MSLCHHIPIIDDTNAKGTFGVPDDQHRALLWLAAKQLGISCLAYILPDIQHCQSCHSSKIHSASHAVTPITVYTLQGPLPCTKAPLRCRECGTWHGLTSYTFKTVNHLYPQDIHLCQFLIRASNKNYVTVDVHELLCESRYVHFCKVISCKYTSTCTHIKCCICMFMFKNLYD